MLSRAERNFLRRIAAMFVALATLTVLAAVAFSLAEHVSFAFGLVWTLDTVTTLGTVKEPLNTGGRVIIAVLELLGIGSLFFGFATVGEFFVSGQLSGLLGTRRTQRMINSLSDHYIVCGYGRVGRHVARDLKQRKRSVVVIESNPDFREMAEEDGHAWLNGNASDDHTLIQAGIERAAAVLSCVDSDAENIFVTLSARELRSDITIVSRSSRDDAEAKLLRAGATRVISPYKTTGAEMARIAMHPQINSISELAGHRIEQIEVQPSCRAAGRTIADVRGKNIIVALEHADGSFDPQPTENAVINPGDRLIALGTPEALTALEQTLEPAELS